MENIATSQIRIKRASSSRLIDDYDQLAIEEPLEIQLDYTEKHARRQKAISITMRTPGNDEELAVGFLFTEGIIKNRNQVAHTHVSLSENKVLVTLNENENVNLQKAERNFYTTSSCGVCGKTSIDAFKTGSSA